jgi:hypothetical protein
MDQRANCQTKSSPTRFIWDGVRADSQRCRVDPLKPPFSSVGIDVSSALRGVRAEDPLYSH